VTKVAVPTPLTLDERMTHLALQLEHPQLETLYGDIAKAVVLLRLGAKAVKDERADLRHAVAAFDEARVKLDRMLAGSDGSEGFCSCCYRDYEVGDDL